MGSEKINEPEQRAAKPGKVKQGTNPDSMYSIIARGAEAILKKTPHNTIVKERIKKNYRINEIDDQLRKSRTKREIKVLKTLAMNNFNVPAVISSDVKKGIIEMEFIEGTKLRDALKKENYTRFAKIIAKTIAGMHELGIIHADLTTSNMILKDNKIYFIDFGLSFFSHKTEDMAVDLNLLHRALESKHYEISAEMFKLILKEYAKLKSNSRQIITRLHQVELRGRNKAKESI